MNRRDRIHHILQTELQPSRLEVIDDSAKHAGHAGAREGGETHYEVRIAAECFRGQSPVARHQMIYKLLDAEFNTGLHALSIKASA